MSGTTTVPAPRAVITSHDSAGTSIIGSDSILPFSQPFGPGTSVFTTAHIAPAVPASNTSPLPSSALAGIPRPPEKGAVFCTTDIAPGGASPMHRTVSLDYCVILKGEIVLKLDGGEEVVLKEGDYIVQRGTMHAWINKSNEWCRVLCIMLAAEKVKREDGKILEAAIAGK
ncbi:cupin 2 domain-containing protein [Xylogone sp. PMI_703]|nr:cupin 2 domain-containing protein [Xylogone sp. PMI_703]